MFKIPTQDLIYTVNWYLYKNITSWIQ
jgi:hypothetical protein